MSHFYDGSILRIVGTNQQQSWSRPSARVVPKDMDTGVTASWFFTSHRVPYKQTFSNFHSKVHFSRNVLPVSRTALWPANPYFTLSPFLSLALLHCNQSLSTVLEQTQAETKVKLNIAPIEDWDSLRAEDRDVGCSLSDVIIKYWHVIRRCVASLGWSCDHHIVESRIL